ncbi:hypothetical protein [Halapricum hydrolyticum]|uniref:DUF8215 domain-containing protein n=1 Tax=Halapricum hydrolyticum TaxID=2979991 RepID=A0AAE3LEP4_9EURY|nr:hypothetical protein [Halapricum hydrolyticum]MCU4717343.1 hypothetical protein [Halapricum hydrolyticum]MCU4726270.1 hypothetical protein [Halapricum hydrolyticum]
MGSLTYIEKSWFGRVLHDVVYTYADVTVFSLPMLLYVWVTQPFVDRALTAPALVTWITMVGVATLIRGGWIRPLGTETLGWVSGRYALLPVRVAYYNLTLIVAVFGGLAVEGLVGRTGLAVAWATCVGIGATLVFPTVVDITYHRFAQWRR